MFLDDDIFVIAVKNTLIFAAITGPTSYILSFVLAWFINELPPKARAIVTLIFYAPSISGAVYLIWSVMFSGDAYGYVNGILIYLGLISTPIQFFQNAKIAREPADHCIGDLILLFVDHCTPPTDKFSDV